MAQESLDLLGKVKTHFVKRKLIGRLEDKDEKSVQEKIIEEWKIYMP